MLSIKASVKKKEENYKINFPFINKYINNISSNAVMDRKRGLLAHYPSTLDVKTIWALTENTEEIVFMISILLLYKKIKNYTYLFKNPI